jgi:hypothetical protein
LIPACSVIEECFRIKAGITRLSNGGFKERVEIIGFVVVSVPADKNR